MQRRTVVRHSNETTSYFGPNLPFEKMKDWHRIALTSLLATGIYFGSLQHGFTAIDDGGQVLENPFVQSLNWNNIKGMFTSETVGMYQPLTTLLFALVHAAFGHDSAAPYHVLSLLLHVVNAALVFQVGKRLFQRETAAFILSLLFVAHPLAVEAVCWVSATSTLLFTANFLGAMLAYDRYLVEGSRRHYCVAFSLFVLGCFAKIQMLPFIGVMFLLDHLRGRELHKLLGQKLLFLATAAGFIAVALHFRGGQSAFTGDYLPQLLVPAQFMWYAWKALLPRDLGIVYDWPTEPWTLGTVAAYVAITAFAAVLWTYRQQKLFVFGILFFFGNLVLHTALASTFLGPFADRYGYLAVLGLWIALISLVGDRKWVWAGGGVVAFVYAGLAYAQTQHWRSTIDLWTHNLSHESATFSNGMRGALYYESGQFAQAKQDFEQVDRTPDPRFEPEKYNYLYTALGMMTTDSEPKNSLRYFKEAAKWKPHSKSFENVALAAKKLGDFETAEAFYLLCSKDFEPPSFYMNLSALYYETQQFVKGAEIMTQAIEAGCSDILCYKMRCFFRIETQDIPGALADYEQAMALYNANPNAEPDPILDNLRSMLMWPKEK